MRKGIIALRTLIKVSLLLFLIMGLVLINGCGRKEEKQPSVKEAEKMLPRKIIPEKEGEKIVVKKGDRIKVQYTGTLQDGTIFDKSKEEEPLEFTVGSGQIIPGFDKAVEGMKLNEEKRVTIKPEDAYGKRDEAAIREFPKNSLPENFKPEKGMMIRLQDQTGRAIPGTVTDITENNITVDLNHPLSGKDLTFNIKVVGIE
jgi:peptidylprolyl isomerase